MTDLRSLANLRNVLLAIAALLVAGGAALFSTAPQPERRDPPDGGALRKVETLRVEPAPVRSGAEVSGVLEPRRALKLFAETRGPVVELGADELDRVEAGQLLVRLDPLLAEVAVERARATLARAESELALARSNLERRRSLFDRGVTSDAELDDAVNQEKVAAAALRQARAELARERDDRANKTIEAPFAGVLRAFPVEEGEYVQEGQQLGELLDVDAVRTVIGLSDREVVAVRAGQEVDVRVEAFPNEPFEGVVLRTGAAADDTTKKFPVEIEVPNPEGRLLPGMVVRVSIDLGDPSVRTLIPRDATVDEFGLRFVYLLEAEGDGWVARRRRVAVRPVPFRPGEFEVVEGLSGGDVIAVSGVRELRDGERVRRNGAGPS